MSERAPRSCPTCDRPVGGARFCGGCGAHLADLTSPSDAGAAEVVDGHQVPAEVEPLPPPTSTAEDTGPQTRVVADDAMTRRRFLASAATLLLGVVGGWWLARWTDGATPATEALDEDGLPSALLEVGDAPSVAAGIAADGPMLLPDEGGRIAVVLWDPSYESEMGRAVDVYGSDGEGQPVLDDETGFLVLSLVSTHLGCRVTHCATSRWFEDPCHGSRWNGWGEWTGGPAPRGLDRYAARIREDGVLIVDLTRPIIGRGREQGVLDQSQSGPACIDA